MNTIWLLLGKKVHICKAVQSCGHGHRRPSCPRANVPSAISCPWGSAHEALPSARGQRTSLAGLLWGLTESTHEYLVPSQGSPNYSEYTHIWRQSQPERHRGGAQTGKVRGKTHRQVTVRFRGTLEFSRARGQSTFSIKARGVSILGSVATCLCTDELCSWHAKAATFTRERLGAAGCQRTFIYKNRPPRVPVWEF